MKAVGAGDWLGLDVVAQELGHAGDGPVRHQAQAHAARVEGSEAVDGAEQVGVEGGHRAVVHLFHEDLVGELFGGGQDLSPAEQLVGLFGHRLETPAVAVHGVAERGEVEAHHLEAALEHERPGHAGVVLEVTVEEPIVRGDGLRGAQDAAPPGAAARVELGDAVQEEHVARLDLGRAVVREEALVALAEAGVRVALAERADLGLAERAAELRHGRGIHTCLVGGDDGLVFGLPEDAGGVGQLLFREEARLATAHAQGGAGVALGVSEDAVVVEEEEADVALVGVAIDVDLVAQRLTGLGERAVIGELATEEPIGALAAVVEVDTEVADQEEVGLAGLDHDAGRHVALVEPPGVLADVGLGPDGALLHAAGLGVDAHDAIR